MISTFFWLFTLNIIKSNQINWVLSWCSSLQFHKKIVGVGLGVLGEVTSTTRNEKKQS
jgi:hypothetical protein